MRIARIAVIALTAAAVGLAACGKKGDPIPPSASQEQVKKKTTN